MRTHRPYSSNQDPVYIGFERQAPRRNGLAAAGFRMSIIGLLSLGFLSPLALLLCMLGLIRSPRGWALSGTLLSLVGVGLMATVITGIAHHQESHSGYKFHRTAKAMKQLSDEIKEQVVANDGKLIEDVKGSRMALEYKDAWGNELRYEPVDKAGYAIRSVGPDGRYASFDDIVKSYKVGINVEEVKKIEKETKAEVNPADDPAETASDAIDDFNFEN